ncbi:MAG: N-formylglutamate amidohydrolase [Calditrichia bacterium]
MSQAEKMPLLLSVPHAGLQVPEEVADNCLLTPEEIAADGDVGAAEIYLPLLEKTEHLLTTKIARAVVDLNRAADDRRKDGIVKTHTCWDVKIWRKPLWEETVHLLLEEYYSPYHQKLSELAHQNVFAGIDCHTMAAEGPPVGPDPGVKRPEACLSNGDGRTCPAEWIGSLAAELRKTLGGEVRINDPFKGGFITRSHGAEMPWIQLELSRASFLSNGEKSRAVLQALQNWSTHI